MALSIAPFPSRGGPMGRKVTFTPRRFLRKIWQFGNFDVSRDGRRLAYAANKGKQWSVYVMDLRTKRTKILLRSEQSVVQPEFSPDGKWLAVQSDFEGDENYNIYVTPASGGKARKVTDTPWDSASPRWSPDGRRIAFLSNRDGDRDNVFVVDASGGEAKQLTNVDDIVTEIAWRPDGRTIAFSAGVGLLDYVGLADQAAPTQPGGEAANLRARGRRIDAVPEFRWSSNARVALRAAEGARPPRRGRRSPWGPRVADRERMAASVPVHGRGGVHDPRPELPRGDGIRAGVAPAERPRSGGRRHERHHRGRPVAPREPALPTGAPRGRRRQLRRVRGRPCPGTGSGTVGRRREHRRILQLAHRDDERAGLPAPVRPAEDGPPRHGRGPLPQVLADLLFGPDPRPRPLHGRRPRPALSRHRGPRDGRGDEEDGEGRRLPRVSGRRTLASEDGESDHVERAAARLVETVLAGCVTHRLERIALRSHSMTSGSACVPIVPIRIVFPRSGPSPPEM